MGQSRAMALYRAGTPAPPVPVDPEGEIWHRLRGETLRWHGRFVTFRDLPPEERTIRRVWEIACRVRLGLPPDAPCPKVPDDWYVNARVWRWRDRALAWDDAATRMTEARTLETKRVERDQRIGLLKGYRAKVVLALQALDPTDMKPGELTTAIKMLTEQLRTEFDDEPAKRTVHAGDPDMPIKVVLGVDMDRV